MLFWILGIILTLLAVYESLFPSSPGTLFIRLFGLAALLFTCVSLLIGPFMVVWPAKFAPLIEPRRAVGLSAFVFMVAHLVLVLIHSLAWNIGLILDSFELLIAMPAFLLFALMALVSSDYALRKLGNANWKRIQRLNYIAFVLILGHFILSEKGPVIALANGQSFINLAEVFLWIVVGATILAQIAGFLVKTKKALSSPPASPPASNV